MNANRIEKTAGCIVIGDEILTGKVQDSNSFVLSRMLFERGVTLKSIVVLPDLIDVIAEHVADYSQRFDHVFTSGGIGPTHDDVTYAAVGKAFNQPLAYHSETVERMKQSGTIRDELRPSEREARLKMALFPEECEVLSDDKSWVPMVKVSNVHILPGVPELFERMLKRFEHLFSGPKVARRMVCTHRSESEIAHELGCLQGLHPTVCIGSYPKLEHPDYRVLVTLESRDVAELDHVLAKVKSAIDGFDLPKRA